MSIYDHQKLEKKWQARWAKSKYARALDGSKKKKTYLLVEFPYPSGDGLHVGHVRSYTALDVLARKRRAEGENVLYPFGWDAFGLPTENYAIKTGIDPHVVTKKNTANFRRQLKALGLSFDWSREINTTDPAYYKWTQWLFLQFWKNGLAYKAKMPINWCPKDKIGLANEEVVDGKCERCGTPVEERLREQWMLAITKYARRLYDDLEKVDYPEAVKASQRNWIGPSTGARVKFKGQNSNDQDLEVFTTRAETIYGATFIALPGQQDKFTGRTVTNPATGEAIPVWEAEYVMEGVGTGAVMGVPAHDERDFAFATKHKLPIKEVVIPRLVDKHDPPQADKPTIERKSVQVILIDPKTQKVLCLRFKKFPWTSFIIGGVEGDEDLLAAARREILEESGYKNVKYVKHIGGLIESHYFASHKGENRKALFQGLMFELENEERAEISEAEKAVHEPVWLSWEELAKDKNIKCSEYETWLDRLFKPPHAFAEEGVLIDSGEFTGRRSEEVRSAMAQKFGEPTTTFKLRDWIFSRQRYWGEPIPLVHCAKCGWQAVPDKDLPVKLPKVKNYQPTETGESPLAALEKWIKTKCPVCHGPARRETDVMPNWAGSSWYYLRYTDPKNKRAFADAKKITYWTPVNWYNGGMEHTTLHLLYSRFWHKFFYDQKLVPTDEPYAKRTSHGLILAGDGEKMSKSRGNVVNPDEIVERFGADSLRLYELFMGPFNQAIAWSTDGLVGTKRFLERVWRLAERLHFSRALPASGLRRDSKTEPLRPLTNQTIKKVGEDIEGQKFNTAVSALMILTNELEKAEVVNKADYEALLRLLAPFAPHLTEELWAKLGHKKSIHLEPWLTPAGGGESLAQTVIIQVNGVTRGQVELEPSASEAAAVAAAKNAPRVADHLAGKELKRVIYRPGRVINFVV